MIAIIDYGVGNLFSLKSSFAAIGANVIVTRDADEIRREMVPDEENRIATLMQQAAAQQYSLCYQPENALLLSKRETGWLAIALTQEDTGFARVEIADGGETAAASAARLLRDIYFVTEDRRKLALDCSDSTVKAAALLEDTDLSLYIGIPFCPTRCAYCSFVSAGIERAAPLLPPFLDALEKENCPSPDETANCFGRLMAELLVVQEDFWSPTLRELGFHLGRFIYLADAAVDAVLSSPFRRAVDTVRPLAEEKGLTIRTMEDFRERRVDSCWIEDFSAFCKAQWADFDYKLTDGESLREVQTRNIAAWQELSLIHI